MKTDNLTISTIRLYNISSIIKKHFFIIFLLMYSLKILSANYVNADFSKGILDLYLHLMYFKLDKFIVEKFLYIVASLSVLLIIFNAILTLILMLFNNRKEVTFKELTKSKLEVIRKQLSIPSWVVLKVPYNPTAFCYLNTLYVPISFLLEYPSDKVKFILEHELTHLKSLDSFFNIIDKSYSFSIAFLIASYLYTTDNYIDYLFLFNDILNFSVKLILFAIIIYITCFIEFAPTRFKEHIFDWNASKKVRNITSLKQVLIQSDNTKSLTHPTLAQRYRYIFYSKLSAKLRFFMYELFSISIFIVLLNSFSLQLVYGFYLIIIIHIIISLRLAC